MSKRDVVLLAFSAFEFVGCGGALERGELSASIVMGLAGISFMALAVLK